MVSSIWVQVPIREFAVPVRRPVFLEPDKEYRTMGVRLWGMGAYERETKLGSEVKASKLFAVETNDLVINRIWVQKGSCGIINEQLQGCYVTQDFPTFKIDLNQVLTEWLLYIFKARWFWEECGARSRGTSGRERIEVGEFLSIQIPLPPLDEQRRIVEQIRDIEQKLEEIIYLQGETEQAMFGILLGAYRRIAASAPTQPMAEIAPLVRRTVKIAPDEEYPELGLRSWGKGTFHKPAIKGSDLNGKRLYRIEAGDLVFSNVFSWEGAVAVARPEDHGRFGSHRFISRVVKPGIASAQFLYFHFMTEEGLQQLRDASPGSAGRNRTLGLKALDAIQVPVPNFEEKCWFDKVFQRVELLRQEQAEVNQEAGALLPAVLERAFRGEL